MRALPAIALALAVAGCGPRVAPSTASPDLGNASSLVRMGDRMRNGGDPASAAGFYERAKEQDPADPAPLARMGDLARALGAEEQAETSYRAALALSPRHPEANTGLAATLLAQGRGAQAVELLEPVARGSTDPKLLRNYGVALDLAGRQADAQAVYKRGLAAAPADADLRSNLALSLAVSGDTDGALASIGNGGGGNAVLLLAMAGRDADARLRGVGLPPDELDSLMGRGRRAAAAGSPAERAQALGVVSAPALSLTRTPALRVEPAEVPPVVLQAPDPTTDPAPPPARSPGPARPVAGRPRPPAPGS